MAQNGDSSGDEEESDPEEIGPARTAQRVPFVDEIPRGPYVRVGGRYIEFLSPKRTAKYPKKDAGMCLYLVERVS